jgi:predicted AlkP superfamily phosphohydrolase/phosphomutase
MARLSKTVLIGLDGATFTVLDPLMREGVMPRLRDFVGSAARAELISTPNPLTPPAWTSLVTGRTPGHHGIFDFVRASQGEQGLYFTLNASYDIRCETIWSIVGRKGGRIASLNFPVSAPPMKVNGVIVPGFVPWRHLRRSVHPEGFYEEIKALPGFDARELSMDMVEELKAIQWIPDEEYESWITHHTRREGQWARIALHLLGRGDVDLLGVLFDGADKLQHLCWRYVDPAFASSDETERDRAIRGWCMDYFRTLDGHIGRILDAAGAEARVIFASDHGFGATQEVFYANVWLEREGYLRWTEAAPVDDGTRVARDRIKSHVEGIDWNATKAFALTPSSNGIWIRRAGEGGPEAGAGVTGEQYEPFRAELAGRLRRAIHPVTGGPLVRKVMTREEAFPGDSAARAPDLTLVLNDFGFISVLNADTLVRGRSEPAGTHRPEGIFIAGGPGIVAGSRMDPLEIIDVAPALLHGLGMEIPVDFEGRVPEECYDPEWAGSHPVRAGEATLPPGRAQSSEEPGAMSEEDQARVMARLQALGYIE